MLSRNKYGSISASYQKIRDRRSDIKQLQIEGLKYNKLETRMFLPCLLTTECKFAGRKLQTALVIDRFDALFMMALKKAKKVITEEKREVSKLRKFYYSY